MVILTLLRGGINNSIDADKEKTKDGGRATMMRGKKKEKEKKGRREVIERDKK